MGDPASVREFAKRYTEAWCSQNAASVAAFYSPGGSLRINDGDAAAGRVAIAEAVQAFMTAFPDLQVVMDGVAAEGENAATYRWTLSGTHDGPGGSGRRIRISGFEEWMFGDDGLILESQGHFDRAEYQRQLERGVPKRE